MLGGKRLRNRVIPILLLVGTVLLISGCSQINEPIDANSTGVWNQYFVYPMSWLITYFASIFNDNFGLSIVIVTVIIRLLLLPLNIKQLKSSKALQEIQPELQALQQKYSSKDAKTQQKLQQ